MVCNENVGTLLIGHTFFGERPRSRKTEDQVFPKSRYRLDDNCDYVPRNAGGIHVRFTAENHDRCSSAHCGARDLSTLFERRSTKVDASPTPTAPLAKRSQSEFSLRPEWACCQRARSRVDRQAKPG